MKNCFTEVINYLNLYYDLPKGWKDYKLDINNMNLYVEQEKKFLKMYDLCQGVFILCLFFINHFL